jgi:hypothetical protein
VLDGLVIGHLVVEDGLEVEDFDARRRVGFVLIVKQQEAVGAEVELDLLEFEGKADVLDGLAGLDIEELNELVGT